MNKTKWALALTIGAAAGAGAVLVVHQRYKGTVRAALANIQDKALNLAESMGVADLLAQVLDTEPKVEEKE